MGAIAVRKKRHRLARCAFCLLNVIPVLFPVLSGLSCAIFPHELSVVNGDDLSWCQVSWGNWVCVQTHADEKRSQQKRWYWVYTCSESTGKVPVTVPSAIEWPRHGHADALFKLEARELLHGLEPRLSKEVQPSLLFLQGLVSIFSLPGDWMFQASGLEATDSDHS